MPPVAPIHWRGVRQANHLSPVCPQSLPSFTTMMNLSTTTNDHQKQLHLSPKHFDRLQRQIPFLRNQSEDCLYLNIYVPFEHYYQHRLYQRQRQQQQNRKLKSTTSPTSSFGK
ncbi:neuroligin-4 [Dermatophagoides farinae]|uniref:Neuroligin-4 n=1 Tax=Dermatophagoides farinae TaxID=6954 RepID=A0A9D4SGM7_DERFA|nr:neuroligin-4 [Dermatophagoides farinae]